MRCGHGAGFTRIVNEVALAVFAGVFSNNLNGVFVCTNGTVCTQAVENGTDNVFAFGVDVVAVRQRSFVNVVVDTYGKTVNRFGGSTVVINGTNHSRSEFFGGQTVAAAENTRHGRDFVVGKSLSQGCNNVEVQRFADRAGLFTFSKPTL